MMNGSKDLPIPFLRRDIWEKYHLAVGIPLDLRVHPHSIVVQLSRHKFNLFIMNRYM